MAEWISGVVHDVFIGFLWFALTIQKKIINGVTSINKLRITSVCLIGSGSTLSLARRKKRLNDHLAKILIDNGRPRLLDLRHKNIRRQQKTSSGLHTGFFCLEKKNYTYIIGFKILDCFYFIDLSLKIHGYFIDIVFVSKFVSTVHLKMKRFFL